MWLRRLAGCVVALALVAGGAARAQYAYPPPPPGVSAPLYAPAQLDQMLASIALYPDPLLTQMLIAATYPIEVHDAAQWLNYPPNAALNDGALANALQFQSWDPSVKSLVPFPAVVRMMDAHLDWTQALGNAFLAQQSDVMDAIQRLRHQALAAGTLVSSPYQRVVIDGPYIRIDPATPQTVYLPVYNPVVVYGRWPYPAYPPIYFGPPPGLRQRFVIGGAISFAFGIGVIDLLWNWGDWDWRAHDVHIDANRFNRINPGRPPVRESVWAHDPEHRRGAPYGDARSRARYERPVPGSPAERQQFRFYAAPQPQQRVAPPPERRPVTAPPTVQQRPTPAPPARNEAARQQELRVIKPQTPAPPRAPQPPAVARPAQPAPQAPATAFGGFGRGSDVQAEKRRGEMSRQSLSAPRAAPPQAQRPAPPPSSAPPQVQRGAPTQRQDLQQRPQQRDRRQEDQRP
jgi:Protein of unknown function (DUF3300)